MPWTLAERSPGYVTAGWEVHAREAICRRPALAIDVEGIIFTSILSYILIQMLFLQNRRRKKKDEQYLVESS